MPSKSSQLSRGDVGAWVFKGNPDDVWDYFGELEDSGRQPGEIEQGAWTLGPTYRSQMVEQGDLVVLWITGKHSPGIYEIGVVSGPLERDVIDTGYLIDDSRRSKEVWCAPFRTVLLSDPVPRADLKADPEIGDCEQFRIPVISNPTYLTPRELQALVGHLMPKDMKAAGWTPARLKKAGIR